MYSQERWTFLPTAFSFSPDFPFLQLIFIFLIFFLQEIAKNIRTGGKKLKHLEDQCAEVILNTSPLGAERMKDELEELRKALEKLKLLSSEEEERLRKIQQSESDYESQARQLKADIQELRKDLQRLENDLDSAEVEKTEDGFVASWRKCNVSC